MCLPHYHSASIFQVIDKIEHAVNTTITEYYGQADKNKFTEAVDKAQQEVRGRVLIKLAVEKSRKIILAWERCCFSQWHKWLGRANPSTRNKGWTYHLLVTCPDAVPAELQETCGNKTCCILLGLDVPSVSWGPADTGGEREPSPLTCFSWELRSSLHHIASKRLLWKNYNLDKLTMRAAEKWKTNVSLKQSFTNYLNLSVSEEKITWILLPSE